MYSVYEISNPLNGKKYVGCTKQNLNRRFQNGKGYTNNEKFYREIEMFGWDTFNKRIICSFKDEEQALRAEEHYISRYKTLYPNGYNLRRGGRSNFPVESVGRNISKAKMGHTVSDSVREKLSKFGRKKVVQLNMGFEYIKTFDSLTDAAMAVSGKKTNICSVCNGKKPTCKGYRWVYLDRWNGAKQAEGKDRVKHDTEII